jgi:hypothetical protein
MDESPRQEDLKLLLSSGMCLPDLEPILSSNDAIGLGRQVPS